MGPQLSAPYSEVQAHKEELSSFVSSHLVGEGESPKIFLISLLGVAKE